jgi:protein required for attachment to host cells
MRLARFRYANQQQTGALMDNTIWVLVADEAIARILQWHPAEKRLRPVEELSDSAAHAKEADLRRDAAGRRGNSVTESAADSARHIEGQRFARRVTEKLQEGAHGGRFGVLRVVAAPHFLGQLRQAMEGTPLARLVRDTLDKELVHASEQELASRLFPQPVA